MYTIYTSTTMCKKRTNRQTRKEKKEMRKAREKKRQEREQMKEEDIVTHPLPNPLREYTIHICTTCPLPPTTSPRGD